MRKLKLREIRWLGYLVKFMNRWKSEDSNPTSLTTTLSCARHTLDVSVAPHSMLKYSQIKVSGHPLDTLQRVLFTIFCPLIHWH